MNKIYTEKAYAKVNFNLQVLLKRADGFHNIESIFQTINLFDELEVSVAEEYGCFVECSSMELPSKNTLSSAYEAFCQVAGVDVPHRIHDLHVHVLARDRCEHQEVAGANQGVAGKGGKAL